jgi:hypothetical protein
MIESVCGKKLNSPGVQSADQQRNNEHLGVAVRLWSGHAIAEAVSRWLFTAAARVRAQVRSCGICGGQSGTGAGFLLRFPLPILNPPSAPHSSSIIRGWYNRSISGRRTKWTRFHHTPKKK